VKYDEGSVGTSPLGRFPIAHSISHWSHSTLGSASRVYFNFILVSQPAINFCVECLQILFQHDLKYDRCKLLLIVTQNQNYAQALSIAMFVLLACYSHYLWTWCTMAVLPLSLGHDDKPNPNRPITLGTNHIALKKRQSPGYCKYLFVYTRVIMSYLRCKEVNKSDAI